MTLHPGRRRPIATSGMALCLMLTGGCATLEELTRSTASSSPELATQHTDQMAGELVDHFAAAVPVQTDIVLVTRESQAWLSAEDKLRQSGYSVTTVDRRKDAEEEHPGHLPVTFKTNAVGDFTLASLSGGQRFQASRLYNAETDPEKALTAVGPVSVTEVGGASVLIEDVSVQEVKVEVVDDGEDD